MVTPKSKAEYRWPHPDSFRANPKSLAYAGFYYNPSGTNNDAVSCFICGKGLADWVPEDDPMEIHAEKCPTCPWAMLICISDLNKNGRSASKFFLIFLTVALMMLHLVSSSPQHAFPIPVRWRKPVF
jgi:hypothetical protein